MEAQTQPDNAGKKQDGRFKPGQSGNPAGKAKGCRNKVTRALQDLLDGEGEALTKAAIDKAKEGDTTALRLCFERIMPARRDNPVTFDLPEMRGAQDAALAMGAILTAVSTGELTPSEGSEAAKLVGIYIEALKTAELEERIKRIEAMNEAKT